MVTRAHEDFSANAVLHLHVVQCQRHFLGLSRFGGVQRLRKHVHLVLHAQVPPALLAGTTVLLQEGVGKSFHLGRRHVGVPFADLEYAVVQTRLFDGRGRTGTPSVVRVPVDLQARVGSCLEQQRHVIAPVASDDSVCARGFDLGHIRREVRDLQQRVQFVAHHLHIGALGLEHDVGCTAHSVPEGIVLANDVDLLDFFAVLHVVGQGRHLDVGIGVPAVVPIAALVVGQCRVHRRVVEVQNFFARVAFVVLGDKFRNGDGRA